MSEIADPLRILFIAPYLPSTIRVRPFQIIRHLALAGHLLTLVAMDDQSPADSAALSELRSLGVVVHLVPHSRSRAAMQAIVSLPTPTPLWAAYCHSPQMHRLLQSLTQTQRFDVAHIEHLRAAHFASALGDLPVIFDAVDCITDLQWQVAKQTRWTSPHHWLAMEEASKLRRYEPRISDHFSQITVTSEHDAHALVSLGVHRPITVIPNGVAQENLPTQAERSATPKRFDLIFSGKMSYQANEDAALYLLNDILPRLDNRLSDLPPITVCIAGASPSDRLRRAAIRWENRVTITGWVDDIKPFLMASRIAVCPIRIGVGIQNKALEAMAMGLPVVATPIAGRALTTQSGEGLLLAEQPESFAVHCADLLRNPGKAEAMGIAGQKYIRQFHRWEKAANAFTDLYRK